MSSQRRSERGPSRKVCLHVVVIPLARGSRKAKPNHVQDLNLPEAISGTFQAPSGRPGTMTGSMLLHRFLLASGRLRDRDRHRRLVRRGRLAGRIAKSSKGRYPSRSSAWRAGPPCPSNSWRWMSWATRCASMPSPLRWARRCRINRGLRSSPPEHHLVIALALVPVLLLSLLFVLQELELWALNVPRHHAQGSPARS